jgi:GTP-binding protein
VPLPVVAIVGRPNVGKSSLFNFLAGRRISIVDPSAGVTRDRVSSSVPIGDRHVELTDTGGMGIEDADNLTDDVERQIQTAIDEADLILFVVDTRAGLVPLDQTVAERLRAADKPVLLVANKCDNEQQDLAAADFFRLGYEPLVKVSAEQRRGKDALFAEILRHLPSASADESAPAEVALQLAIVGRRNVGKSTFINKLAQSERVIVSEVPGTTRDSVDVRFERDGKTFIAIDTAGVRNRSSLANDVEFYSLARAQRSIRRADVVLHFFDARLRISRIDKQLTDYILEHQRPAIFVVNKWDLVKEHVTSEDFAEYVRKSFPMLDYVPIAFVTAKNGKNVHKLLNLAQHLHKQAQRRINTGDLNRVLARALEQQPPPTRMNRFPKIFYATQVGVEPPTILLFTNGPHLFDDTYRRYLTKVFRDRLPFAEVPIKLEFRSRHGDSARESIPPEVAAEMERFPDVELTSDDTVLDMPGIPAGPTKPPAQPPQPEKPKPRRRRSEEDSELWNI